MSKSRPLHLPLPLFCHMQRRRVAPARKKWRRQKGMIRRRRRKVRVLNEGRMKKECLRGRVRSEWRMKNQRVTRVMREMMLKVLERVEREEVDEEDVAGNERENVESGQGSEEVVEGEIPTDVEGEIHVDTRTVENEEEIVGEDDGENVENEEPVDESVNEPESEGLKEIVDLEDGPDGDETPVDERTTRRNTRRSRQVDELVAEEVAVWHLGGRGRNKGGHP